MYYDPTRRLSSYQEVSTAAFGPLGGWLAFFFTAITLVGVPVLYILLSGSNLHNVARGTSSELTFPSGSLSVQLSLLFPSYSLNRFKKSQF
ncbi:hypothetical protein G6F56_002426 [Rhizopus delemar]|nr:hypothetical protein G6F56_002426 [Rhizopus delemar]